MAVGFNLAFKGLMERIPFSITVLKSIFYESKFKCFVTQDIALYPNTTQTLYLSAFG